MAIISISIIIVVLVLVVISPVALEMSMSLGMRKDQKGIPACLPYPFSNAKWTFQMQNLCKT